MIYYLVGKIKVKLFLRYSYYIVIVNRTVDKVFELLDLGLILLHLLLKHVLLSLKLAVSHQSRDKRGYRGDKEQSKQKPCYDLYMRGLHPLFYRALQILFGLLIDLLVKRSVFRRS